MLEIINLSTGYSKSSVITHLDNIIIPRGEPLGVAGINGAGKTTFLKTIAGVIPIVAGEAVFYSKEKPLFLNDPYDMESFRSILGYCPDVGGIIPAATPNEHVNILLSLIPKHRRNEVLKKAETVFERVGLKEVSDVPCGNFSHGMLRRTSVALAYLNADEMLILDEPFDGVDPDGVRKIQSIVEECIAEDKTVIISSHLINVLAETVDNILVMAGGGKVKRQPAKIFRNASGIKKYNEFIQEVSVR
jgi:ABC-2 type transport system ATP-binding protein